MKVEGLGTPLHTMGSGLPVFLKWKVLGWKQFSNDTLKFLLHFIQIKNLKNNLWLLIIIGL